MANTLRGEVAATIAGQSLRLRITMAGLAQLSGAINATTFGAILERLRGMEPRAVMAAIEAFAVDAAIGRRVVEKMGVVDLMPASQLIVAAFAAAYPAEDAGPGKPTPAATT